MISSTYDKMISITDDKMISISEIQSITEHCMNLLSYTEYLRRDGATKEAYTFAEGIFGSIRKLFIATMMYDKKLICVSGLQGAGKTTLMRNFYKLDSEFLDPTRGRGERVPVLITEKKNIKEPEMYAIIIDKDDNGVYYQQKSKLSADEYISATKGGDSKIMYLELFVPYSHTNNEGISFMLLPGFEKKNDYWNNLIEFSVNSSDAAVFVFNETSFSNADNDKYLSIVEGKFGNNLVYAISGSDGSQDDNLEVKQTCIRTLNIPESETERVVCVGSYTDQTKNTAWIKAFEDALEKYAYRETQQFQRNSGYMYKEIHNIKENLYQILGVLNSDSSAEMKEYHDDALLNAFDKAVKKKRTEFEGELNSEFKLAKNESLTNLEQQFVEDSSILKLGKRRIFGATVKDLQEARMKIDKSLKYDGEHFLSNKHLGLALQNTLRCWDSPKVKNDLSRLIDTKKEGDKTLLIVDGENTKTMYEDICHLLSDNSQTKDKYTLQNTHAKRVVGAVAEISAYYFSLASYDMVCKNAELPYYEPAQSELVPDMVISGAESSKKFVAGMAGLMGIDFIEDGSINMVAKIASEFGKAAPFVSTAIVAIIGTGAASVVMQDLNRMQREDHTSARLKVEEIYDNIKKEVLRKFDTYMDKIRDRIEDNITEFSGDSKKILVEYNAKVEINNTLDLLDCVSKRQIGDVYGLESAFS